jgi:hypothetical protein
MCALTIWQPWADALGDKNVENRSWPTPPWIIGEEIGIHAGRTLDLAAAPPCGCSWPAPSLPGAQVPATSARRSKPSPAPADLRSDLSQVGEPATSRVRRPGAFR